MNTIQSKERRCYFFPSVSPLSLNYTVQFGGFIVNNNFFIMVIEEWFSLVLQKQFVRMKNIRKLYMKQSEMNFIGL